MKSDRLANLDKWLSDRKRGGTICYHRGFLAADRYRLSQVDGVTVGHLIEPLNSIATTLMRACERGKVILCQRKRGTGEYEYYATKT